MNDDQKKEAYVKNKKELISLFEAVQTGTLEEIKKKIEKIGKNDEEEHKAIFNTYKEGQGKTVFHFAASRGDIGILKYMIEHGADLNCTDDSGNTPLFIAAQHGNLGVVRFFIEENKCDPKATRKGDISILHLACSIGQKDLIVYLLEKGLDINASSDMGVPVEVAVSTNKIDVIELLLEKGANPNGANGKGKGQIPPPLIMAISFQNEKLFSLLLDKYNADPNCTDMQGWTALQFSAEIGKIEYCKRLLAKGGDPNYECMGQTALDLAFQEEQMECVELLRPLTTKAIQSKKKREVAHEENVQDDKDVNEEEATKLKNEGNEFYKEKKYEEAIQKYDESLQHNRKTKACAAVYTNKAICLILLNKPEEALKMAQLAKQADKDWIKAYVREAQAYFELKEYGESAATYFEALKMDPTNSDIRALFNEAVKKGKQAHGNYN